MGRSTDEHVTNPDGTTPHVEVEKGTENGACLTGHESRYRPSSCSYRWQALTESKENRKRLYDKTPTAGVRTKSAPQGFLATSAYLSEKKNLVPSQYSTLVALPQEGDWHLDGPHRDTMKNPGGQHIRRGKNFTKDTWPYWHNSHHLIPKGVLNETIAKIPDADCQMLVRLALLRAQYNINHHVNVIILPQDMEVARVLGLPRHLILEDGSWVIEDCPKFNHAAYNMNVLGRLKPIINRYKTACDNELRKNCDTSQFKLSKEELEELSRDCYKSVTEFGTAHPGSPISDMPPMRG
ncbi:AHH domain-containing protein [Vitiosangium sp. GDMCC 1.1324]|uniref:AHH domain-containing protein n=1 Tax=Vitiosangium sp. (strain GDMCC 1.1324) TaxID=2138576 RepID=UPI000D3D6531|nr:AHH domain-containing protein [Vitiosangium sp. GDMCC 1.1324]PTL77047.1 hypothetical protein DAT35_46220 [Vitiosangium sp. GDMCC 1.1324]